MSFGSNQIFGVHSQRPLLDRKFDWQGYGEG